MLFFVNSINLLRFSSSCRTRQLSASSRLRSSHKNSIRLIGDSDAKQCPVHEMGGTASLLVMSIAGYVCMAWLLNEFIEDDHAQLWCPIALFNYVQLVVHWCYCVVTVISILAVVTFAGEQTKEVVVVIWSCLRSNWLQLDRRRKSSSVSCWLKKCLESCKRNPVLLQKMVNQRYTYYPQSYLGLYALIVSFLFHTFINWPPP